jgi:hypothetical protein
VGSSATRRDSLLAGIGRVVVSIESLWGDSDVDGHAMFKVLEARNQRVAMTVFEDDTSTFIQTIEVLDCCDNGVGCVVRVYVDSHG